MVKAKCQVLRKARLPVDRQGCFRATSSGSSRLTPPLLLSIFKTFRKKRVERIMARPHGSSFGWSLHRGRVQLSFPSSSSCLRKEEILAKYSPSLQGKSCVFPSFEGITSVLRDLAGFRFQTMSFKVNPGWCGGGEAGEGLHLVPSAPLFLP